MGILGSKSFEELPEHEQEIIRQARENQKDLPKPAQGPMPPRPQVSR